MKLKIPPAIQTILFAGIMWLMDTYFSLGNFSFVYQKAIAIALFVIGAFIGGFAIWNFVQAKTTSDPTRPLKASKLVKGGIYKYSRNPMYLAIVIVLIGWIVALGNVLNIIILFLFIWYITKYQIKPEEEALSKLFGEKYTRYCDEVKRWI